MGSISSMMENMRKQQQASADAKKISNANKLGGGKNVKPNKSSTLTASSKKGLISKVMGGSVLG